MKIARLHAASGRVAGASRMAVVVALMPLLCPWPRRLRPAPCASGPPRSIGSSAAWPVSDRNTSSSVGWRSVSSDDPRCSRSRPAQRWNSTAEPSVARERDPAGLHLDTRLAAADTSTRSRGRRPSSDGVHSVNSSTSPPICALSSSDVPFAMTLPVVDHRDAVGQHVGLVEVLGRQQQRRAAVHELLMTSHSVAAATRIEPGRGFVEEQHDAGSRPGSRRGRAGGACRPSRSGPAGRRHRSRRNCSSSLAGAPPRLVARQVVEASDQLEVLPSGERVVDGGVLSGQADCARRRSASRTTSWPATGTAGVRRQQRGEDAHRVVFPAPFGPRSPRTEPVSTVKSMPSSATTLPNDLRRPSTRMAGSVLAMFLP